ncbi:hypothetical protein ACFXKY_15545 [Streptomyces canus]|uniref:hypothetical protein n=1 Tax=Streptomyces canus TaxID=58343 RepID=UPI0036982914
MPELFNRGGKPLPEYKPSDAVLDALAAWKKALKDEEDTRKAVRKALADELKANPDLPYASVANHPLVPWSEANLRIIGNEHGVPPRQPNKAKKQD